MKQLLVLLLLLFEYCVKAANITCSVKPCDTSVCPGTQVVLTSTTIPASNNWWKLPAGSCPARNDSIFLEQAQVLAAKCDDQYQVCGPYSVQNQPSTSGMCLTSSLTFVANTTTLIKSGACDVSGTPTDLTSTTVVTKDPPGPPAVPSFSTLSETYLTVVWAPPITGGVPTSYNVSINDSSSPVVIPNNRSFHTFTGLARNTCYTISVVANNCAGTSNTTSATNCTWAVPPNITGVEFIFGRNIASSISLNWTAVDGVHKYTVRIYYNQTQMVKNEKSTCTIPLCGDIFNVLLMNGTYNIFMASENKYGIPGTPSNYTRDFYQPNLLQNQTANFSPVDMKPSTISYLLACIFAVLVLNQLL